MHLYNLEKDERQSLIRWCRLAIKNFHAGDWQSLGVYTNTFDLIQGHDRLLRSLSFSDEDYSGHAHAVIFEIAQRDAKNLSIIEDYIRDHYGEPDDPVSLISTSNGIGKSVVIRPSAFRIPNEELQSNLVSVMTPFHPSFEAVFTAISSAAADASFQCLRAKDIWLDSTVIQDVFSLIYRSHIVVCNFTGKNPNVFYEAGIAHTLGKHVIPITQSASDIPFDLMHHRYLAYLNNSEGLISLKEVLESKFRSLASYDHPEY